ncbi:hypothetical protein D9M69_722170 [compost metagenome]
MVLRLGQHHALRRNQLGGIRIARGDRHFHRLDQRLADMAHHFAPRRLALRVQTQLFEHGQQHAAVRAGFLQVFQPFLLQVLVDRAGHCGLVHIQSPYFRLQSLI